MIEHTKYYCQGKFSSEDGLWHYSTLTPNGPVVWGVAVGACPELSEGSGLA